MEHFSYSPRSPLVDSPVCDSDEEVFFGPVTSKELQKASKLKRRTQFLFPTFDWDSRISPLARDNGSSSYDKEHSTKVIGTSTDQTELSLSSDSLESQSFVTLSDERAESSKGEYCTALSGNSLDPTSEASLNEARMISKLSDDSSETRRHQCSAGRLSQDSLNSDSDAAPKGVSKFSNISDDSLEEKSKNCLNVARFHSENSRELTNDSNQSLDKPKFCTDQSVFTLNQYSCDSSEVSNKFNTASESSVICDSHQYLNTAQLGSENSVSKEDSSVKSTDAMAATYDVLPGVEENDTYTVENNLCEPVGVLEPSQKNADLPKEVKVDQDGGYLSILSEAALYHAAQLKEDVSVQSHALKDQSACSAESLEDRFRLFGIDAGDFEEQQLTNSIMYVTGRDSNAFCAGRESNTFYTGRGSVCDAPENMKNQRMPLHSVGFSSNSGSSFKHQAPINEDEILILSDDYGRQKSLTNSLNPLELLNQPANTSGSSFQDTVCQEAFSHEKASLDSLNENEFVNESNKSAKESSEVSGMCQLNTAPGNNGNDSSNFCENEIHSHNDSGASSYLGDMNDTLEEYEMMMRYGVDYILGRKGNQKKKSDSSSADNSPDLSGNKNLGGDQDGHPDGYNSDDLSSYTKANEYVAATSNSCGASPSVFQQNTSVSSAEYQDAVDLSPSCKRPLNAHFKNTSERKVLSPRRQVAQNSCTPAKVAKDIRQAAPKGNVHRNTPSGLSKLPRVASVTPSRMLHCPSSQSSRQFARTGTPSSGVKSNFFKKPITPNVPSSRIPKTFLSTHHTPKSNQKMPGNIQSPISAYIHNTPSPILVTNVKAKPMDKAPFEKEMHARAVWRAGEIKSFIPRPGASQMKNSENINPNVGCGLPSVKYKRAPCIKLDEATKLPLPKGGEKITKLLDAPSPQVIKHEGRLQINCGSPQLAARMQSVSEDTFDDSMVDIHSVTGDISVCVSKHAIRTDTLGHK